MGRRQWEIWGRYPCEPHFTPFFADKITSYADYVHSLDRLTAYVSDEPLNATSALGTGNKCASVSRRANALFQPRLHLECPEPRLARYVYVKATGLEDRWRNLWRLILCEIMVY